MQELLKIKLKKLLSFFNRDPDRFLRDAKGVIHIGANTGQEREQYAKYDLKVIWIEPIPEVFEILQTNLKDFPFQQAFKCLISELDDTEYEFNVASNNGASSSILDFKLHKDIWSKITYESKIKLRSKTLVSLLKEEKIDLSEYDTLIMDTQGSELLVLGGAAPILKTFTYIKTEVPDFESYKDCCQLKDINMFLRNNGYYEFSRQKFASHPDGGSYYDIVYKAKK